MKGIHGMPEREAIANERRYDRAKRHYSIEDARQIVDNCVSEEILDRLVSLVIAANMPARVITPQPGFHGDGPHDPVPARPTNALPFALAALIAADLDCEKDETIVQTARPGRTFLGKFPRFLWQPAFEGDVRPDRAYILVDDVCTNGGTLAALRSHIVANGGTVIAATTLAHTSGNHQPFPIERGTYDVLKSLYGDGLDGLWESEIGHDIQCLTEGEGMGLADWSSQHVHAGDQTAALHRLRGRLDTAKREAR